MGIIIGLFLIGYATFWLVESCSSVLARIPMKFNVGIWGFVFPSGTYALALSALSVDLRNDGLKGWAAACTMFVILLWMLCATGTVYKAFWKGEMFYAPGLEGWIYHDENEEADGNENNNKSEGKGKGKGNGNGNDKPKSESAKQVERMQARKRITNSSGTYTITKPGPDDEELGHGGRKRMPENGHAQAGGHGGSDADHDRIDGGVDRS